VDGLLKDIPALKAILTYHVVPGYNKAKKIGTLDGKTVATVNGKEIAVKVAKDGKITLAGSVGVVTPDIKCGNGYIHVIDTVLMPPADA
jgi:uncharacterized surface protein with fasciclin (FAS1) repeats